MTSDLTEEQLGKLRTILHQQIDRAIEIIAPRLDGQYAMTDLSLCFHDSLPNQKAEEWMGRAIKVDVEIIPLITGEFAVEEVRLRIEKYGELPEQKILDEDLTDLRELEKLG